MKIAHISDIHLDSERRPTCIDDMEQLLETIFSKGYSHVVMTGDIVDVANFDDLYRLREVFIRLGLLHWERVTIIPGNHDIFGKYELDSEGITSTLRTTASRAMMAKGLSYAKRVHAFCDIFRETITTDTEIKEYFPFVKILTEDQLQVSLVSFNSVLEWSLNINPTGARGYIHATERFGVLHPDVKSIVGRTFPIALFHHAYEIFEPKTPADKAFVWSMELIERDSFLDTLKALGIRIALHGHYHKAVTYSVDGIHFMNSGSVRRAGSLINSIDIFSDYTYHQSFLRL